MFRRSALRLVNWGTLIPKLGSEEAKMNANALRAYYAQIDNLSRKYPSEPAPVDFAAYKGVVQTPGMVEKLEAAYNALNYAAPDLDDFQGMLANHGSNKAATASEVKDLQAKIVEIKERIKFEEANKTNHETTLADWKAKYPEAYAEAEEEVANHQWFDGVVTPYGAERKEEAH